MVTKEVQDYGPLCRIFLEAGKDINSLRTHGYGRKQPTRQLLLLGLSSNSHRRRKLDLPRSETSQDNRFLTTTSSHPLLSTLPLRDQALPPPLERIQPPRSLPLYGLRVVQKPKPKAIHFSVSSGHLRSAIPKKYGSRENIFVQSRQEF